MMRILFPPLADEVRELCTSATQELIIVSPWIKLNALLEIIKNSNRNPKLKVLIKGDFSDFADNYSDDDAIALLLTKKAEIKIAKNLHAKVYIADDARAIVSSANLTSSGLGLARRGANLEMGVDISNEDDVLAIKNVVNQWFDKATAVSDEWLILLRQKLEQATELRRGSAAIKTSLEDFGKELKGNNIAIPLSNKEVIDTGDSLECYVDAWHYTQQHQELRDDFICFLRQVISFIPYDVLCAAWIDNTLDTRISIRVGRLSIANIYVKQGDKKEAWLLVDDKNLGIRKSERCKKNSSLWDVSFPFSQMCHLPNEVWESFVSAMRKVLHCDAANRSLSADELARKIKLSSLTEVNCDE